jgi:hypothetical protein
MSEPGTIAANLRQQRDQLQREARADYEAKCKEIERTREDLGKLLGERDELGRLLRELTPRRSKGEGKGGGDDE